MRIKVNHTFLLGCCVLLLVVLCCLSVDAPLLFNRQRTEREYMVKHRLIEIRIAEEKYCRVHGAYTGSFEALTATKLLADSLSYIPFSQERFSLKASSIVGKSGQSIPVMECGAQYSQYLNGLDKESVTNLTDAALASGRYPGLKIGDLEMPNNNKGNWE